MPWAPAQAASTWSYPTPNEETISSRGNRVMKAPSTRSSVAATAMPRTRGALSAKNLSRSLASENLTRLKAPESPFTMTGLGGPIRRTSAFSAIFHPLWYFGVSHQHRHGSLDKSLERRQQFGPERAVDHAVIAGERHREHAREGDAAVFLFDRLPPRRADREDRRLRRIDDGGKFAHAVPAEIGDGGGTALVLVRCELSHTRPRRQLLHLVRDCRQRFYLRPADHRRDQAAFERHRDGDVATLETQDAILRPYRIGGRHALQRGRPRLDDEVVEGELEGGLAVAVLGCGRIRVFAQRDEPPDLDVRGQVEMRDGLLRLHQPGGDGRAHAVERHLLERHVAVERLDVFGARTRGECDAGGCGSARHRLRRSARGGPDIARHDAAVRAGRRNGGEIDASFRREPTRQRRHASAAGEPRRAVVALRRAHLEERIELDRRRGGLARGDGRRAGLQSISGRSRRSDRGLR